MVKQAPDIENYLHQSSQNCCLRKISSSASKTNDEFRVFKSFRKPNKSSIFYSLFNVNPIVHPHLTTHPFVTIREERRFLQNLFHVARIITRITIEIISSPERFLILSDNLNAKMQNAFIQNAIMVIINNFIGTSKHNQQQK